jgi:hypothetical protein
MIVSSSLVASSSSQRFSWVSFSLQTSATASLDDGLGFFWLSLPGFFSLSSTAMGFFSKVLVSSLPPLPFSIDDGG